MLKKTIDTSVPINDLIASRWSGVAYDASRPVASDALKAMAEAARWAPSCFGDQPWRYIICNKTDNAEAWQSAFECLAEGNKPWCQHAPVLIIACADTLFSQNDKPNSYGPYDTGAASISMCLQATELGLMTHQMAGFDPTKASAAFNIPARYQALAMMTVGYELPEEAIPEDFKARELAPRSRNPLASQFFAGEWGKGL